MLTVTIPLEMAVIARIAIILGLKKLYFYYFSRGFSTAVEAWEKERNLCFIYNFNERSRDISYHIIYFLLKISSFRQLEKSPSGSEMAM